MHLVVPWIVIGALVSPIGACGPLDPRSEDRPLAGEAPDSPFPWFWATCRTARGLDEDFKDLVVHGVKAVSVDGALKNAGKLLEAARKHGVKLIMSVEEVSERAWSIPGVERAVMIAGAYQGEAIDRYRFAFSAGPQKIDATRWKLRFDLTGVKGDLGRVILAVYWISEGTRKYWMFGDAASASSPATRQAVAGAVREALSGWRKANGGAFPVDVIIALCFVDECFQVSGHLNSPDGSYPLWDYYASAIAAYRQRNPKDDYPRGKPWIDVFGRQALGMLKAIAYVDVNAKGDLMHFAETVAVNRSLPVTVFSTVAEAEKWILGGGLGSA